MNPIDQFHNQFVTGGLVLMFTGSLMALAKDVPRRLWAWIKRRCTVDVRVENSDPLFDYITYWLDSQPYSKKSRTLSASTMKKKKAPQLQSESRVLIAGKPATKCVCGVYDLFRGGRCGNCRRAMPGRSHEGNSNGKDS